MKRLLAKHPKMHALPDAGDGSAWPLGGVACCGDEIEDPGLGMYGGR